MRPSEASDRTLEEIEGTAVTGQTVSVRMMTSVTVVVPRASLGKLTRSSVLEGQSMTSGRHEVMVRTEVVDTVRVVSPETLSVVSGAAVVTAVAVAVSETPVDRMTEAVPETLSAEALERVPFACLLNRRYLGCLLEYAEVRAVKRPRVR
jgi:hypothetical protein